MIIKIIPTEKLLNNPNFDKTQELIDYKNNGPKRAKSRDAGVDLRACITEPFMLYQDDTVTVSSGFRVHIGSYYDYDIYEEIIIAGIIIPRSGLGHNHGIILGNSVGCIDETYTGELLISLHNRSTSAYTINPGDRIAQLMVIPTLNFSFEIASEFEETDRGSGGFGHSGVN